jgi:hypothetical protein
MAAGIIATVNISPLGEYDPVIPIAIIFLNKGIDNGSQIFIRLPLFFA